jgi:hypothetical protein
MTTQTLTKPTSTSAVLHDPAPSLEQDGVFIVAREHSELARHLRSSGWLARSGWRSTAPGLRPAWLVRFESPATRLHVAQ